MKDIPAIAAPRTHVNRLVSPDGHIGLVPWRILRVGNNLRVSIGIQQIDISTPNEMRQAQALCSALSKAMAEAILR